MKSNVIPFAQGFSAATPIMLGYFPVAVSFGLLAREQGLTVWQSCSLSLFMFSGAGQFLFLGLWQQAMAPLAIIFFILLLNSRHLFYGPILSEFFSAKVWQKPWLAYWLTDEVFALNRVHLQQLEPESRISWYSGSAVAAYGSWNLGTLTGALGAEQILHHFSSWMQALAFALPALFLLLLLPYWKSPFQGGIVITLIISALGSLLNQTATALLVGSLIGTTYSLWRAKRA